MQGSKSGKTNKKLSGNNFIFWYTFAGELTERLPSECGFGLQAFVNNIAEGERRHRSRTENFKYIR